MHELTDVSGYPSFPSVKVEFRPPEVDLPTARYTVREDGPRDLRVDSAAAGMVPSDAAVPWQVESGDSWDTGWKNSTAEAAHNRDPLLLTHDRPPTLDPRDRQPALGIAPASAGRRVDDFDTAFDRSLIGGGDLDAGVDGGKPFKSFLEMNSLVGAPVGALSEGHLGPSDFGRGTDLAYDPNAARDYTSHGGAAGALSAAAYINGKQHLRPDVTPFSPGQAPSRGPSNPAMGGATHWSATGTQSHTDWSVPAVPSLHMAFPPTGADVPGSMQRTYSPAVSPLGPASRRGLGSAGTLLPDGTRPGSVDRLSTDLPDTSHGHHIREQWGSTGLPASSTDPLDLDGWSNVPKPGGGPPIAAPPPTVKPVFGDELWGQGVDREAAPRFAPRPSAGYDDGDEKFYDALLAEDTGPEARAARNSEEEFLSGVLRGMDF